MRQNSEVTFSRLCINTYYEDKYTSPYCHLFYSHQKMNAHSLIFASSTAQPNKSNLPEGSILTGRMGFK